MAHKKIIPNDCHFYDTKTETIVKDIAWLIAAGAGVILPYIEKNSNMGSVYFLFSLSLLIEFVPKHSFYYSKLGRFFYGIFNSVSIAMFVISTCMVIARTSHSPITLLILCIVLVLFFIFDILVALFAPNEIFENTSPQNDNDPNDNDSNNKPAELFLLNSKKGNLGNIEGDD